MKHIPSSHIMFIFLNHFCNTIQFRYIFYSTLSSIFPSYINCSLLFPSFLKDFTKDLFDFFSRKINSKLNTIYQSFIHLPKALGHAGYPFTNHTGVVTGGGEASGLGELDQRPYIIETMHSYTLPM